MNFQEGEFIYINKPYRMSSFGALAYVRTRLSKALHVKRLKTGHAGTLDPLATGVLILCTGKATKRIESLQLASKEYTATLQLGATTPCFDLEKPIDKTYPTDHITLELIEEILPRFRGRIEQIPPAFSACKVDGHRAYKLARKGEEVELKPKVRCRTDATDLAHRMQQRNIHPGIGTRHWSSSQQRSPSHRSASHAHRRRTRRTMYAD